MFTLFYFAVAVVYSKLAPIRLAAAAPSRSSTTTTTSIPAVTPDLAQAIYVLPATEAIIDNTTLKQATGSDTNFDLPKPPDNPPALVYAPGSFVESCGTFSSCSTCISSANGCGYCMRQGRCIGAQQICPDSQEPITNEMYCPDRIRLWEKATSFGFITGGLVMCAILAYSQSCCTHPSEIAA